MNTNGFVLYCTTQEKYFTDDYSYSWDDIDVMFTNTDISHASFYVKQATVIDKMLTAIHHQPNEKFAIYPVVRSVEIERIGSDAELNVADSLAEQIDVLTKAVQVIEALSNAEVDACSKVKWDTYKKQRRLLKELVAVKLSIDAGS
jgi:hypothetical protein